MGTEPVSGNAAAGFLAMFPRLSLRGARPTPTAFSLPSLGVGPRDEGLPQVNRPIQINPERVASSPGDVRRAPIHSHAFTPVVFLVPINLVQTEEPPVFVLKRLFSVMLLLGGNILDGLLLH